MDSNIGTSTLPTPPLANPQGSDAPKPTLGKKIVAEISKNDLAGSIVNLAKNGSSENARNLTASIGKTLFAPVEAPTTPDVFKSNKAAEDHERPTWKVTPTEGVAVYQEAKKKINETRDQNIEWTKANNQNIAPLFSLDIKTLNPDATKEEIESFKKTSKEGLKTLKEQIKTEKKEARQQKKEEFKKIPASEKFNYGADLLLNGMKKLVGDGSLRLGDEYHQDIAREAGISDASNLLGLVGDGGLASVGQVKEAWKLLGENELKSLTGQLTNYATDLAKSFANNLTFGLLSGKKKTNDPREFLKEVTSNKISNTFTADKDFKYFDDLDTFTMQGQPVRSFFSFGGSFEFAQQIALGKYRPGQKPTDETIDKDLYEVKDITSDFFRTLTTNVKYLQPFQFYLEENRSVNGINSKEVKSYRIESFDVPVVSGSDAEVGYGALNTKIRNPRNNIKYSCNFHVIADYRLKNFLEFCKRAGLGVQRPIIKTQTVDGKEVESDSTFMISLELPKIGQQGGVYTIKPTTTSKKIDFNIGTLGEDTEAKVNTTYTLKIVSDWDIQIENLSEYLDPNKYPKESGYPSLEKPWNKEFDKREVSIDFKNFRIVNVEPDKFEMKSNPDNSKPTYGFTITASWTSMYISEPWKEVVAKKEEDKKIAQAPALNTKSVMGFNLKR